MRKMFAAAAMAALAACGGGDEFVRSGSRTCAGPFLGSLDHACSVELRLDGKEVIHATITGTMLSAANTSTADAQASRSLRIQLAGVSAGFQTVTIVAPPGAQGSAKFTLRADVPTANLAGYPAVIGLGSLELLGDLSSTIVEVTVSAEAE